MRYGQITTRRLSWAAKKLAADGQWHRSESTPRAWYRVWRKRLVQRASFEDDKEEEVLLPTLHELEPVDLAVSGGFREELTIRLIHDQFQIAFPIGYAETISEALLRPLEAGGISFSEESGLLVAHIPLPSITTQDLAHAQEQLIALRDSIQEAIRPS